MNPENDKLAQTLAALHTQLEGSERLEPEVAERLEAALAEIRAALAKLGSPESDEDATLVDRLRDSAEQFSESHPVLSGTLTRLVDTLAQMGI